MSRQVIRIVFLLVAAVALAVYVRGRRAASHTLPFLANAPKPPGAPEATPGEAPVAAEPAAVAKPFVPEIVATEPLWVTPTYPEPEPVVVDEPVVAEEPVVAAEPIQVVHVEPVAHVEAPVPAEAAPAAEQPAPPTPALETSYPVATPSEPEHAPFVADVVADDAPVAERAPAPDWSSRAIGS